MIYVNNQLLLLIGVIKMTIQNYLFICCVGGSLTGSFIRWFYPCIFKEQQKRAEFTALNMLPTLVVGACLGLSVAVFFNSDISHFEEVHASLNRHPF